MNPGAGRAANPGAVRRRYVLVTALTWLPNGLILPVLVLLMSVRGIGPEGVGLVFAVFGVTVALLELPTGGLADVIGRRTVLAASALGTTAAVVWLAFATDLREFLAIAVAKGVARALSSGPAEAWLVDTLHEVDATEHDVRHALAAGNAASATALAVGTVVGGTLPALVPSSGGGLLVPLSAPALLAAAAAVGLFCVAVFGMAEPARGSRVSAAEVWRAVPRTIRRGAALGVRDDLLRRVLITAVALGTALNAVEMLTPGRLAQLTGDAATGSTAYAVVAAIGFAATAIGSVAAPRITRAFRRRGPTRATGRTAAAGGTLAAFSLAGLAVSVALDGTVAVVAAAVAYAGMFAGLGVSDAPRAELLHSRVTAGERATVLSVDSLLLQCGGAAAAAGLGLVAAWWSPATAWWIAAGVLLVANLAYLRPSEAPAQPRPTVTDPEEGVADASPTGPPVRDPGRVTSRAWRSTRH